MKESRFYSFFKPLIPSFLRPFVLSHQEVVSYLVFGVLTTVVNFLIYFPLKGLMGYLAANVIAWVGAVAFAFGTNKFFVFEDERRDRRTLWTQAGSFAAARVFSLVLEEGILWLCVGVLDLDENWVKLAAQVVVIVTNYITSKLLVFRK